MNQFVEIVKSTNPDQAANFINDALLSYRFEDAYKSSYLKTSPDLVETIETAVEALQDIEEGSKKNVLGYLSNVIGESGLNFVCLLAILQFSRKIAIGAVTPKHTGFYKPIAFAVLGHNEEINRKVLNIPAPDQEANISEEDLVDFEKSYLEKLNI